MAGIALLLDFVKRNPHSLSTQSPLHSYSLFSAAVAASAAAASIAAGRPFASRSIFGDGVLPIAYCDAAATVAWEKENIPSLKSIFISSLPDTVKSKIKEYPIELKPIFSAFGIKSLAMTSLRSFLLYYLPLLEPRFTVEEEDDDITEAPVERPVDLVTPFHSSLKQIVREISVVTTRRILERLAVHYCSRRIAWKLLKDVSSSAKRKASREMPSLYFAFCVSRTTFRGHALVVGASWSVQVIIEIYRCFFRKQNDSVLDNDLAQKFKRFGKKFCGTIIKCSASLVFASIGGGIGALFHPSIGQWIGCALGDFAGPVVAVICFEKLHLDF